MIKGNLSLGQCAEDSAADFLKQHGYSIIKRNYRNKLGEIDIIARHKGAICFVEVKARRSVKYGLPQEAVSPSKRAKISRVALSFLKENHLLDSRARFDVVSILYSGVCPEINLIQDAFELEGGFIL